MKSGLMLRKMAVAGVGIVAGLVFAALALGSDSDAKSLRLIGPDITPKIVLPAQASEVERFAAKELSEYLEKITGVQCPVISGTAPAATAQSPLIILGSHVQNNDLQPRKLGPDDSIISVEADRLRIVGGGLPPVKLPDGRVSVQERGTLYGVYHLLNQLGVRWFRPEPWGEHVPKLQVIELSLGRQDFKPAYKYRDSTHLYTWYTSQTPEQAEMATLWSVRNFLNVNSSAGKYGGSYGISIAHNYNRLLPPQKYFKDHPEYFALVDGKRMEKGQPCLGNPQVQRIMADAAVEAARRNPAAVTISLSPNDGGNWCECKLCRALDDPELTSPNGAEKRLDNASMTNRVAYVNNLIARRVGAAVPGMKVAWYAYLATTEVPTRVKELEPNIYVAPTTISAAYGVYSRLLEDPNSRGNRNFLNILQGWSKLTPLLTREYWSGGVFPGPVPMLTVLQDRLKNYRQYKVDGIINESHPSWGTQGILHYFLARLLWNPDLDMNQALEEYCRDYYGPADGPMVKYHRLLEKASLEGPEWYFLGRFLTRLYENTDLVEQMGRLMDEALPLAKGHEPYEKRLYGDWAGYKVALAVNQAQSLLKEGKKDEARVVWLQLKRFLDDNSDSGEVFNTGSAAYAWNTMSSELGLPKTE